MSDDGFDLAPIDALLAVARFAKGLQIPPDHFHIRRSMIRSGMVYPGERLHKTRSAGIVLLPDNEVRRRED
jgi:hypothetical protein